MIGACQSNKKQQERDIFGRQRDGSLIEEGFITATIVVIISERKKIPVSNRLFFALFDGRFPKLRWSKTGLFMK